MRICGTDPFTNSTWSALGAGLSSAQYLDSSVRHVNAIRLVGGNLWVGGRFSSAGGAIRYNLAKWVPSLSQWQDLATTIIKWDGTTTPGPGLNSQTIMVTSIDPNGVAVGVAHNGLVCVNCPTLAEAYYTVEDNGMTLRGQNRSVFAAGMRAVHGNIAGHDQMSPPPGTPSTTEIALLRESGLSQLGTGGWQLLGYGGPAFPPLENSPYWPAGSIIQSGWKAGGAVNAIVSHGADVYLGGEFNVLSGAYPSTPPPHVADYSPFNHIFKWNSGSGWTKLANAPGVSCIVPDALGLNGPVYGMDVDYSLCNGSLAGIWVGGAFAKAGGGSAWNIAFWTAGAGGFWNVPVTPTIVSPLNGAVFLPPANVFLSADSSTSGCPLGYPRGAVPCRRKRWA